jgi:ankyrin repeat protein
MKIFMKSIALSLALCSGFVMQGDMAYGAKFTSPAEGLGVPVGFRRGIEGMWFWAVKNNHPYIVKKLLDRGMNPNIQNDDGQIALTMAVGERHAEMARILIAAHADLNVQNGWGETALMTAARRHAGDVATLLVAARASVNIQDNAGVTALMLAAIGGDTEMVKLLIKKHANLNDQDGCGNTALITAVHTGRFFPAAALVAAHADLNIQNNEGETALMWAAYHRNVYGMESLLKDMIKGSADPSIKDNHGDTVLARVRNSGTLQDFLAEAIMRSQSKQLIQWVRDEWEECPLELIDFVIQLLLCDSEEGKN